MTLNEQNGKGFLLPLRPPPGGPDLAIPVMTEGEEEQEAWRGWLTRNMIIRNLQSKATVEARSLTARALRVLEGARHGDLKCGARFDHVALGFAIIEGKL